MKVLVGITSNNWCAAHTTRGMAPYSRFDVTIQRFKGKLTQRFLEADSFDNYDVVYLHSSRLIPKGVEWMEEYPSSTKWGCGIRGFPAYKKYRARWQRFDFASTPSHQMRKIVMEHPVYPMHNVHVCHQGVDPEVFRPMPELRPEEFTLVWGGNPHRGSKRVQLFLRLPYTKRIAGTNTLPLEGGVGMIRDRDELARFYNSGSVYVQTGRNDAFSACPVEAAFCGVPAVGCRGFASRGGCGVTEYVPDEWMVDTHEIRGIGEEHLYIEKLNALRDNPDLLAEYGDALRAVVLERYTHEKVAMEYDRLFESVGD